MNILIADDHALIREGVKHSVLAIFPEALVLEAHDGASVLQQLEDNADIDIILLDLMMPDVNGLELLDNICAQYADIPVIILSAAEDPSVVKKALDTGASGFIPKSTSHDIMLNALNLVLSGGVYIPPQLLANKEKKQHALFAELSSHADSLLRAGLSSGLLSARQIDVLKLMTKGLPNKRIASELGLSENTIKIHVTAILKALNASNRTEAVVAAQHLGIA